MRENVINLAAELAQNRAETTGNEYAECINWALDKACEKLMINRKDFIKIFLR